MDIAQIKIKCRHTKNDVVLISSYCSIYGSKTKIKCPYFCADVCIIKAHNKKDSIDTIINGTRCEYS